MGEIAERNWPVAKMAMSPSSSRRKSKRDAKTMSGSEKSITPHAYTEIMIPVWASVSEKVWPMSLRRPMGMNSEVLKIKAETASPASASH